MHKTKTCISATTRLLLHSFYKYLQLFPSYSL